MSVQRGITNSITYLLSALYTLPIISILISGPSALPVDTVTGSRTNTVPVGDSTSLPVWNPVTSGGETSLPVPPTTTTDSGDAGTVGGVVGGILPKSVSNTMMYNI